MKGCRPVTRDEFRKILKSFRGRYQDRDRAMFVFGCSTGFRISEILSIKKCDIIDSEGRLKNYVTVQKKCMKGKKESRTVYLNDMLKKYLRIWIVDMEEKGYLRNEYPLFFRMGGMRMDRVTAWRILKRAYARAEVEGRGMATHTMRKTFVNNVYEFYEGRKDALRIASKAVGHKSIDTTDKYLSYREEDAEKAIRGFEDWE